MAERNLHTSLRTARGRSNASQRWLARQLNDPYVKRAKAEGWRSRAAFKLLELDAKFRLLRPGLRVVDLGAAPGGWTQVAARAVGGRGRVVGLDLLAMDPVAGATLLQGDFEDPATERAVLDALGGPADLVLSDMAPNTTGHNATDHIRITALAELALAFAERVLAPGGGFACKLFQGGAEGAMLARMKRGFAKVSHAKPPASRKESSELYVVATGSRPAVPEPPNVPFCPGGPRSSAASAGEPGHDPGPPSVPVCPGGPRSSAASAGEPGHDPGPPDLDAPAPGR